MPAAVVSLTISVLTLLCSSCRGTLPPTEPPRVTGDGMTATPTNDASTFGPLAAGGPMLAGGTGSGGTSVLPPLPPAPPGGGGGAGGVAGSGIR